MADRFAYLIDFDRCHPGPVIGLDEVGRGPWAGPVVAAAVILPDNIGPLPLDDSKKLSAAKRDALFEILIATASYGIGQASVDEIDQLNILQASLLAMRRAYENCLADNTITPTTALVDGNKDPGLSVPTETVVKGDGRSAAIAAASIIAKVTRDRLMAGLAEAHPHYGWETNMGYGTKLHQEGLSLHGITPHHRRSFKPIHNILCSQDSA